MPTYTSDGLNLTIPGRIRCAMDRAGIHRQADLARASGVSEVAISNIMLLKNGPSPSTLRKIARALGVTEEYLRGVERYRPESNSTRCWTCQNAVPEIRNARSTFRMKLEKSEKGQVVVVKKEVCAKVYKTTDYSAFRFLNTNRDPRTYKHVIKSIDKIGWQHDPILVNEKNEIIDGQNRFLACKELGLPIEFMIQEGATIETARSMNVGQKNWVPMDYVKSFAADGDQNYQLIKNLAERWRGRVALPGLAWCVSPNLSKGSQSGAYSNIASGNFKCSIRQYNYVNMALEDLDALKILDFADAYKMSAKTWIPTAFYAYMHPDVDISRFSKQIWKRPELIPACTTTAEQLDRVSAAYNAGLAKKKNVYLKTDFERGEHLDIKQAIIRGRKKY